MISTFLRFLDFADEEPGSYDDYYQCDHLEYVKACPHGDFFNRIQKLQDRPELKNKNATFCCSEHGFVYEHACEVPFFYYE